MKENTGLLMIQLKNIEGTDDQSAYEWTIWITKSSRSGNGVLISGFKRYRTARLAEKNAREWAKQLKIRVLTPVD